MFPFMLHFFSVIYRIEASVERRQSVHALVAAHALSQQSLLPGALVSRHLLKEKHIKFPFYCFKRISLKCEFFTWLMMAAMVMLL